MKKKSCKLKFQKTSKNIVLHKFLVFKKLLKAAKKFQKLQKLALGITIDNNGTFAILNVLLVYFYCI